MSSSSNRDDRAGPGPSIAITQPRRLPCLALARRVSEEMGCELGGEVGYSVRFEEAMSTETRVRYLTEGVMMRSVRLIRFEGFSSSVLVFVPASTLLMGMQGTSQRLKTWEIHYKGRNRLSTTSTISRR